MEDKATRGTDAPRLSPDRLLTVRQTAEKLNLQPHTLNVWRCEGQGPPYHKIGRSIRYRASDLTAWLETRRVSPEAPTQ